LKDLTGAAPPAIAVMPAAITTGISDLDTLSDEEAEALLLKKLESIH
jgi:hypothetical protein